MERCIINTMADPADFDPDYYVIDEPPAPAPRHDARAEPVTHETMLALQLQLVPATPRLPADWTVPLDLDWAEDD